MVSQTIISLSLNGKGESVASKNFFSAQTLSSFYGYIGLIQYSQHLSSADSEDTIKNPKQDGSVTRYIFLNDLYRY